MGRDGVEVGAGARVEIGAGARVEIGAGARVEVGAGARVDSHSGGARVVGLAGVGAEWEGVVAVGNHHG
ncbi:hypothetical protein C460_13524 [Haloferax sp. ATCC BAA-646]|nr:hypothetical protein C460_13524 [Haloferax sp. ATCC BAA-646]ELZ68071.1 hypothetical protein C459_00717 [Haloferax sp. ATCC BAA-645]